MKKVFVNDFMIPAMIGLVIGSIFIFSFHLFSTVIYLSSLILSYFIILLVSLRLVKEQELSISPIKAPGSQILKITAFLYSEKHHERVFIPIISDMREEWFKAYGQKEFMKARWIKIRYLYAFIQAMGINAAASLVKNIFNAWNANN